MIVSVVIPCHDGGSYLGETIRSVLLQTCPPREVIVVLDDCSDDSLEIVRGFDGRVKYAQVKLRSAAASRNLGARLSCGDAVMFLDADDVLGPTALEALQGGLSRCPDAVALCPWFRLELAAGEWIRRPPSVPSGPQPTDLLSGWLQGWYYPPCSILWSRQAFQRAGGWSEDITINDDGDLVFRALAEGIQLVQIAGGESYYRRVPNSASLSGQRLTRPGLESQIIVYERLAVRLQHKGCLQRYRYLLAQALLSEQKRCHAAGWHDLADKARQLRQEFGAAPALEMAVQRAQRLLDRVLRTDKSVSHLRPPNLQADAPVVVGDACNDPGINAPQENVGVAAALAPPRSPSVSVVIPTYNRAALLQRAIRSVLNQTFGDFEVVVVDDASTDETGETIAAFADTRIRYFRQPRNLGVAEARNRGLCEARGDFIALLDSDDEWLPTKLEEQMARFEAGGSGVGLVYCGARIFNAAGYREDRPRYRGRIFDELLLRNVIAGGATSSVIRRNVIAAAGFFDPAMPAMEDYDYWLRVARFYSVDFVDRALVRYYDLDDEDRRSRNREADISARDLLYRRHLPALRKRKLAGRFLMASARRRLGWISPPDRLGALRLTLQACIIAPRHVGPYRALAQQLIPERFRSAIRLRFRAVE